MRKRIISKIYNSSPKEILMFVKRLLGKASYSKSHTDLATIFLKNKLIEYFRVYKTSSLCNITPEEFASAIQSRLGSVDAQVEGYSGNELDRQRDLSVKYHWGHNHDFGAFKINGRMGDRHINLLAQIISLFPISLDYFSGKKVFDVGCWTGGTSLLLAALGGKVHAIEEVVKYAETVSFLVKSFGIEEKISIEAKSIYSCNSEEYFDRFEIVYFPGVIYHLSDPLLAIRILFNSLKVGGIILIESAGINREESFCKFEGSFIHKNGRKEDLNRGGWNWFLPSPNALDRMMREAGFDEVETLWHNGTNRIFGFGRKLDQVGICRAGLSVPDIM